MAGAFAPAAYRGVTLSGTDVKYYTTNEKGEIDRLILSDVTGDLWEYAALDGIQAATDYAGSKIDRENQRESFLFLFDKLVSGRNDHDHRG